MSRLQALWAQLRAWYASRPPRDQRVYLALAVAVALSLVYLGPYSWIRDHRESVEEEIEQKQRELERSARFLGAADALRADRDTLRKRLDAAKKELLPGNSGTLGAAALQERTTTTANEKGVAVQSVQVMREETFEPYHRVAVRLTLSTEVKPLAEMIAALEYQHHLTIPFFEVSRPRL